MLVYWRGGRCWVRHERQRGQPDPSDGPPSHCPAGRRLRPQQRGLGGPGRFCLGVWGIACFHFATDTRMGRVGGDRRLDWPKRHQLLADLDFGIARGCLRRLAVLLDWAQARTCGRAYVAAVSSP